MKLKAILLLSCVWCVAARELPMVANAVAAGPQQYVGVVDGTNVYVRYNASVNAYPCTKLSRPQRVTVTGSTDGWLEILPPPGVFSAVAKDYVKPDAGGKSGVVTANRVWIRAGGDLRETNFTGREIQLNSGDKVVIIGQATYDVLGETKEYYKIVPPKGVRFWISDRYVKPLETASASPVGPPAPSAKEGQPATQPSAPTATTLPVVETRSSEKELTTAIDKFRAVEKELIRQFAKPPAARDYQRLIGRFQALKVPPDSHLQPYIDYYIDYLKFAIKKDADRKKFQALVKNAAASQAEYDIRRTEIETAPPTTSPVAYTGQGVLEASAIYTGTPGSPKRFLLRDEQTGVINAYVEPAAGLKIDKYVGKKVGLLGKSHFDSEIMTEIIKADHVVVLEDRPVLPKPPEDRSTAAVAGPCHCRPGQAGAQARTEANGQAVTQTIARAEARCTGDGQAPGCTKTKAQTQTSAGCADRQAIAQASTEAASCDAITEARAGANGQADT